MREVERVVEKFCSYKFILTFEQKFVISILGRFYFKQTQQGNLIGEYSNQNSKEVWSESANKDKDNPNEPFIGKYTSTWGESDSAKLCELTIEPKRNTTGIFSLSWIKGKEPIFKGEGFIADNILIGDYQDCEE